MKIRIVGGPGSGKTTIAKKLAKKYSLKLISTDEIRFASKKDFSKSRSVKEKTKIMNSLLKKYENWIIEGSSFSAYSWKSVTRADFVFIMKKPLIVDLYYILRRSFRHRFALDKNGWDESFFAFIGLFRWAFNFRFKSLLKLLNKLKSEKINYVEINKIKKIEFYLESNK